jgi:hypothetical protein
MPNMAVDVIQSATFELKKSCALHNAQTNLIFEIEPKRTCIFTSGDSVPLKTALACRFIVLRWKQ